MIEYVLNFSIVKGLKDCIDLGIIDGLSSGLEDSGDGVLGCIRGALLGAFPLRLARATAEAYCMCGKILIYKEIMIVLIQFAIL